MQKHLEALEARREGERGFTLIELLIVIVVLGILAAIVVFALSNQTSNAAQSSCRSDAKSVEIAQEAFRALTSANTYAASVAALVAGGELRTAPGTGHYQITTNATGIVSVLTAGGTNPLNFDTTPTACNSTANGGNVS